MEQGDIWRRRSFRPPVKVHPRLMSDEFMNHLRRFDTFRTKISNQSEESTNYSNESKKESTNYSNESKKESTNYSNELKKESKCLIENRKEIIIKTIFFLVFFTALAFNVNEMSVKYFNYSFITEVLVTVPKDLEHPSMTLCTAYQKLIDKSKLVPKEVISKLDKGEKVARIKIGEKKKKKVGKSDLNVTISQIFEFTPSESELIVDLFLPETWRCEILHQVFLSLSSCSKYCQVCSIASNLLQDYLPGS